MFEVGHEANQTYVRPAAFDLDYGLPAGLCAEVAGKAGVFCSGFRQCDRAARLRQRQTHYCNEVRAL